MKSSSSYIFGIFSVVALSGLSFAISKEPSKVDLPSLSRSTEVGKAVPTKEKVDKELEVILKDPALSQAWGLNMTEAQKAWRVSKGSKDIVVAVIDTGIDVNHPDLANNLWVNPGETGMDNDGKDKASNGKDDDGNGFIDDVHGWNFVKNDNNLQDSHGHGTHIAGIIGAEGGNGVGISGVAPKVSLMALKYYDPKSNSSDNLSNTVKAINYAVQMNAHIINYSGGGLSPSPDEKRAIEMAMKKGILVVAAAGNEKSNSDIQKYYPADYGLPNIVSVTAIDKKKEVLPSSNWGVSTVHIAAPGNNILSTLPNGQYGQMTGTSQATAFVSGVAALIMANNNEMRKADRIIKYLTQTGDSDPNLTGKTMYAKRLNTYKALALQDMDLNLAGSKVENSADLSFTIDSNQSGKKPASISSFGKQLQALVNTKPLPKKD
ncbi:S8 family serine peptidase [bacterium]|nr:S8 family serine peptidase [bacterium]